MGFPIMASNRNIGFAARNQAANGNDLNNQGSHTLNGNGIINDNDTNNINNSKTVNVTKNEFHFHEAPKSGKSGCRKAGKGKGKGKGKAKAGKGKGKGKCGKGRGARGPASPQQSMMKMMSMMLSMMEQMQGGGMAGGGCSPMGGAQPSFGGFRHPGFMR